MDVHRRQFAEIDVCPRCGGAFFDAGEGASVHGAAAEVRWLVDDARATRQGRAEVRCPAHAVETASDYRDVPKAMPAADAPWMDLYLVGDAELAVEVDLCPTCGGFFLDAGEGLALLSLAAGVEKQIVTESGAVFSAPPSDNQAQAVDQARHRGAFGEMMRAVVGGLMQHQRERYRREQDRLMRERDPSLFDD